MLITVPVMLLLAAQFIATPEWAGGGAGAFARIFSGPSGFESTSIQQRPDGGIIVVTWKIADEAEKGGVRIQRVRSRSLWEVVDSGYHA